MEAPFNDAASGPVWEQQPTPRSNYICNVPDCYSVCHSSLLLTPIRRLLRSHCGGCNHPHLSHSHTRSKWVQVTEPQTSVDEREKRRQDAAKDDEKTKALIARSERELADLNHAMDKAMEDLARLTEEYTTHSLSGSFSIHVEKAIR